MSLDVLRAAPVVREILDAVRQWRTRRSAKRKESLKAQIVHILGRSMSGTATVAYVSEDALGQALKISASELRPLLDELVVEVESSTGSRHGPTRSRAGGQIRATSTPDSLRSRAHCAWIVASQSGA
jgi:hypothetical protein